MRCNISPGSVEKLLPVVGRSGFRIRGRCIGRTDDPSAWQGYSVTLEDCEVLALLAYSERSRKRIEK